MSERIHELLLHNLQEVFGEGDSTKRRSASRSSILTTVWSMSPQVFFTDRMNSINLQATCEQRILILSTCPTILRRPSIMLGVSYGAPVLAAECLPTREWT
jgi:hypothetical protein